MLKGFHSSFSALDELSLLAVPYMLKGRFIVIDDIERKHTKLTIDEILGFIDECVQNHECRILLVLNSDKLEDQKLWGQIREKVVDQEIKLETSPSEAFDIAQKLTPCPWPQQMKLSLEPFQITNIRIIRKVIRAANQLLGSDPLEKIRSQNMLDWAACWMTLPKVFIGSEGSRVALRVGISHLAGSP